MSWLAVLPAIAVGIALLLLPGAAVGWGLRLRGLSLWATAPLLSTTLVVTAAVLLGLFGVRWSPTFALLTIAAIAALATALLRRWSVRLAPPAEVAGHDARGAILAWLLAAVPLALVFILGVGSPEAFTQRYDNIFHLNQLQHIADTGEASALTAGRLQSPTATLAFYPNAWHAFASLIGQITGVSIPASAHVFNLLVITVVWPLGALALTRQLMPSNRLALWAAGAVAGAMSAFPIVFMHYGVLYAYCFGLSLVPALLAHTLRALGVGVVSGPPLLLHAGLVLACTVPGVAVAHPSALMAALTLSMPLVWIACLRGYRQRDRAMRWRRLGLLAAFMLLAVLAFAYVRPGFTWSSGQSVPDAIIAAVSLGFLRGSPIVLSLLALVGAIRGVWGRTPAGIAIFTMWVTAVLLYILGASLSLEAWRDVFVGVWYGDLPRIAAILCIAVVPAAAYGFSWLLSLPKLVKYAAGGVAALPVSLLVLALQSAAGWNLVVPTLREAHTLSVDAPILSIDEHRLLMQLPELVPADAVIAGSPWTGTAQAYALAGREVVLPHPGGTQSAAEILVLEHLRDADSRPDVCEAAVHERIQFVLDFGTREPYDGNHRYPGIEGLETSNAATLVASEGEAKLYRVTACDFGD